MATITGRTDRRTDGQTDRQTDRVRRNMRPPSREEGRIIKSLYSHLHMISLEIMMNYHNCACCAEYASLRQWPFILLVTVYNGRFRGARGPWPSRCQTLCNMTLKQHNPGVHSLHCNKKNRHQWHQNMPFIFTWPLISGCVL